jgi:dihydropteroate synthase
MAYNRSGLLGRREVKTLANLGTTRCGNREFTWGERTYIMGVINMSPDSFSGDGLSNMDEALLQAERFESDGVDIIDIGGESTRPRSEPITPEEEIRRVVPIIERLSQQVPVPLSIDTYKWEVAQEAVAAGARMLNDIWGLKREPRLADIAAKEGIPVVLMSNQRDGECQDIISEVFKDLKRAMDIAIERGVPQENIILDPGIGFGKTLDQNLEIVSRLDEFSALGRPLLIGTSRKSMIGLVLDLPTQERLEGTAAPVALGISKGADIVRVHDIPEMKRVCQMSDAIVRGRRPQPED